MTKIFGGRAFSIQKEKKLTKEIDKLKKRGITPKLVSILVGRDKASKLYVSLKKKAGERIGASVSVEHFPASADKKEIIDFVKGLEFHKEVHGIMIQLPLPKKLNSFKKEIINAIPKDKDVDGLREDSDFNHPTSLAVLEIIKKASSPSKSVYCVVGGKGMVGKNLVKLLKKQGKKVISCDSDTKNLKENCLKADVLISAVGKPKIIKSSMVKKGTIVIDVGSPGGDVDLLVQKKASFITPVPGGVGPVTISFLLDNLIKASIQQ